MDIRRIYQENDLHIQQTNYTCGPCALLNLLLLKGDKRWDEPAIAGLCAAKPGVGTENEALLAAAQELGLKLVLSKADADLSDIEKHLDQGHYVLVNYLHAFDGDGHYGLIAEHDARTVSTSATVLSALSGSKNRIFPNIGITAINQFLVGWQSSSKYASWPAVLSIFA